MYFSLELINMSGTKIQLSSFETELVQNSEWILTKRGIIDKVYLLFGNLSQQYVPLIDKTDLPLAIKSSTAKISKGENYHGLPYVVLDYPRVFDKENTFAVRTLFWWGNYFSSTFHLKGQYKEAFLPNIKDNYPLLAETGYFIGTGEDEWDFRFTENNFKAINQLSAEEWNTMLQTNSFTKLSIKIPLTKWDEATNELHRHFQLSLQCAGINFRDGETNL